MGPAAARHAEAPRSVRCEHGRGLAASGRERVDPTGGRDRVRHEDRAEEHELVPLPGAGDRGRDRAPGGARAGRRPVRGGGAVEQETLHFDTQSRTLSPLRSKEYAHDYRYFPEPDLVPLVPTEQMLERARAALPELPAERAKRFESDLGLPEETAKLLAFRGELGDYFEAALAADSADARTLANWVRNELVQRLGDTDPAESKITPEALASLVGMVEAKSVSQSNAKEVLAVLVEEGGDPARIVEERGMAMAGDDELESIVSRAIEADPDAVEQIKSGNQKAIGALMGAIMRETKGRVDGKEVQRLI